MLRASMKKETESDQVQKYTRLTGHNYKRLSIFASLILLIIVIPLVVVFIRSNQDIRQRAAEPESSIVDCQVNILASAAEGAGAVSTLELGNTVWVYTMWQNKIKSGDLFASTNYCPQSITGLNNITSRCIDSGATHIASNFSWLHRDQDSSGRSVWQEVWKPQAPGAYKVFCRAAGPPATAGSPWEECRPPELSVPTLGQAVGKSCRAGSITTLTVQDTVKPTATITASKTSGFINGETITLTFGGTDNTGGSGVGVLHTMIVEGVSTIEGAVASGKWTTDNATSYKGVTGSTTTRTATVPFYAEVTAEDKAKYDETNTKYAGGNGNVSDATKFAATAPGTPTNTPTPTSAAGATATPTPTTGASASPSPSPTAGHVGSVQLTFNDNIKLQGNSDQGAARGTPPVSAAKAITAELFDTNDDGPDAHAIASGTGNIFYNTTTKNFGTTTPPTPTGTVGGLIPGIRVTPIGTNTLTAGTSYTLKIKSPKYLRKRVGTIIIPSTAGPTATPTTTPAATPTGGGIDPCSGSSTSGVLASICRQIAVNQTIILLTGDITNQNVINIQGYNILIDCGAADNITISPAPQTNPVTGAATKYPNCGKHITSTLTAPSVDLNDDGFIDAIDLGLLTGNLRVQRGD